MAKVITFSRAFPAYHSRKGQETFFVEKVLKSFMMIKGVSINDVDALELDETIWDKCKPKHHTIRAGHRFKTGDMFSPRCWSGRPYHTQQVILADDVKIEKVWDFVFHRGKMYIDGERFLMAEVDVAKNDGLSEKDFLAWFKYPQDFHGQIICWNENIKYE